MANKILTVSELAEHLNVHRITIYRLLKSGTLPGFKIGRVWRFDLDEITAWMASGKSTREMAAAADGIAQSDGHLDGDGHMPMRDGHPQQHDGHPQQHDGYPRDGHPKGASSRTKPPSPMPAKESRGGNPPRR